MRWIFYAWKNFVFSSLKGAKNGYVRRPPAQPGSDGFPPTMPQYSVELDLFERRLSAILNAICDMIDKSERRLTSDEDMAQLGREWQDVAVTMDRLLLTAFLLIVSTVFLMLFVSATGNEELS